MNTNKWLSVVAASMWLAPALVRAADADPNPLTHPVMAYDKHEVKENKKEMHEDKMKMMKTEQSMKEREDFLAQRKSEYEKALNDKGRDSEETKHALDRYEDAQKSYKKSIKKNTKATHELNEDRKDLDHAQSELSKDQQKAAR